MQIKLCESHNVKNIFFLSRGSQVKVLAPEKLKKEIQDRLKETLKLYK